jgi:rhodanese-related sulfurtransferase
MNKIKLLDNEALKALFHEGKGQADVVIIDIREPMEYAREHIAGSINIPVAQLKDTDFSVWKDKIAVFYCQLGNRTHSAKDSLQHLNVKEIYCIQGGISAWKQCDLPVEVNRNAPIDVMRQVQIVAGLLVLIGTLFAYFVSPLFLLLSGFVGAGLVFAGLTGFCGMAKLLMWMPFNQISTPKETKNVKIL